MTKIFYHKLNVFLYFILCLVFFILPLTLIIRKSSEIKLLVYPIILITICGYYYYRIFKAFIHIVIGKPIIEFTSEKYIDNLNGVSIKWKDVQRISLENRKAPFIIFTLKNDSQFYNS
ncbi:hypothetical protein SAMN05444671_2764 [Flavobacterium sp. CF108]|nr:hypothetical protein SAMN04487978_2079 [Flavobacterium sp. fv08]SHH36627.1 hypothetical protein SAMN05444671_2764 [Flavobacterium sp. CF108]